MNSATSIERCRWDGVPRDMGSMLIADVASWAKPGAAGDLAPIAAALAVAERRRRRLTESAVSWACAGSVAATTGQVNHSRVASRTPTSSSRRQTPSRATRSPPPPPLRRLLLVGFVLFI